ncbi:unnamed protein product [Sympodiomycopsis kandeliae]
MKITLFALSLALVAASLPSEVDASHTPRGHGLRASLAHHRRILRPKARANGILSSGQDNGFNKPSDSTFQDSSVSNLTDTKLAERSTSGHGHGSGKSDWKLITSAQGKNFFDAFTFYQGADPTKGSNHFVSKEEAQQKNLISINKDGNAVLTVQKGSNIGSRASVHITTKDTFTGGLFIVQAKHIPVGCGLWPATWLLSSNPKPSWPSGGEIDIIEGANEMTQNMYSMHTTSGCWAPQHTVDSILGKFAMADTSQARNCDAKSTDDQGCGIRSSTSGNYGAPYNKNGGGVHAFLWTENEAKMFFWERDEIPKDIASGSPDPSSWSKPEASWGGDSCQTMDYVWNLQLIVSMALCGTWAGSASTWSGDNQGGQKQSCAKMTGKSDCNSYLAGNPDLSEAYWEIEKISIYQSGDRKK